MAAVSRAQDLTLQAGGAWAQASAALDRQTVVKEAYAVAPEAGSKKFLTDEAGSAGSTGPTSPPQARTAVSADTGPVTETARRDAAGPDATTVMQDKLRLADRMPLRDGESVAGSDAMSVPEGVVCAVGVASPDGPRVHVGLNIDDEDKTRWRGEDKGSTLVFDQAAALRLQRAAGEMAAAEQAGRQRDRELRDNTKALEKRRDKLLKQRYGDLAEPIGDMLDSIDTHRYNLRRNKKHLDQCGDMLAAPERAAYDTIEQEIAAEIAKMPTDTDLDTPGSVDRQRVNELRKQQKAILAGLTPGELRTLEYLEEKHPRRRTPDEAQQLRLLHDAPGGVQQRARHGKDIINFDGYAEHIDAEVIGIATSKRSINQLRSRTVPNPALDDLVAAADSAYQQANNELFEFRDGTEFGTGTVPAQWGSLVWATTIDEDGRVRHDLDRRPPDAEPGWQPGSDPVRLTTAGVRKFTALVTNLMTAGHNSAIAATPAPAPAQTAADSHSGPWAA